MEIHIHIFMENLVLFLCKLLCPLQLSTLIMIT